MRQEHSSFQNKHLSIQQIPENIKLPLTKFSTIKVNKTYIEEVKTRALTPIDLADDRCSNTTAVDGGFWLASVVAGAGSGASLPPHVPHSTMDPTCGTAETGFINSQPSMAEFMTALPQITNDGSLQQSPNTGPISPGTHHPTYHNMMDTHGVTDSSNVNVPEYPWMKEKKTTRKNSQQGKLK